MSTSFDSAKTRLGDYLSQQGLKHTRQRDLILEIFMGQSGHLTSEQLYREVEKRSPAIGVAAVYRALKLFVDAGIATANHFYEGVTVYEPRLAHHDHLLCLRCSKVVEFEDAEIEERQEVVASERGFELVRHRHDLYGYCADCR